MFVLPLTHASVVSRRAAPARDFRAIDRLFDESIDRFFGGASHGAATRTPSMDVSETNTAYTVVLDVPGVTREQLKVSIDGRRVSVSTLQNVDVKPVAAAADVGAPVDANQVADTPAVEAPADARKALYRERSSAAFSRTVSLPAEVDQAASQAKLENGVLTLTLTKRVATGASQLTIG